MNELGRTGGARERATEGRNDAWEAPDYFQREASQVT